MGIALLRYTTYTFYLIYTQFYRFDKSFYQLENVYVVKKTLKFVHIIDYSYICTQL